jgi:ATP-binding cassette subfamily C protein
MKTGFGALFQTIMKNTRLSYVFNNADALVRYLANMIIFIYSGFQIMGGHMTIGQFTMINAYSVMVIGGLSVFLGFGKTYRSTLVAYDRIMEIQNTEKEENGISIIDSVDRIVVKNLGFSYGDRQIFKNLNFEMTKGNIYTIVGENGSGKSTLLGVLTGMAQGCEGEVWFGSANLRDLNVYHLRDKCLAIVDQEPVLYFESLRENIMPGVLGRNSSEDVRGAGSREKELSYWIDKLNLTDLITSLPGGLDYNISEKTTNLSGGEKQRLAEVGALIKNVDVIILDEPNSALDKNSLMLLCEVLKEIKRDKIVIVVTHDRMLIEIADVVVEV